MNRRNDLPAEHTVGTRTDRLTVVDEIFLHKHRGLGLPSVMQGVWRTDDHIGAPLLISLHDALSQGPLGRRVVRSKIPGARPHFEPTTVSYPVRYTNDPLGDGDILDWADAQAEVDLDPSHAPGWALAAAPIAGGGTVVSLVCSHVLTDARGLIDAVTDALAGKGIATEDDGSSAASESDLRDALQLTGRVVRGLRNVRFGNSGEDPPPPHIVRSKARTALVDVDAATWDDVAHAAGGSSNSLFLAITTGIATRAGLALPLRIAIPVDVRESGGAPNGVMITELVVDEGDTAATLRAKTSAAYHTPREAAPYGIPDEILHLMPDRVAAHLARESVERELMCSNIGRTPPLFDAFGPHPSRGVAMRAMHPGLDTLQVSTPTKLSSYLNRNRGTYSLALVALDEDAFPDTAALRRYVDDEMGARGLEPAHW
ncbi:hypothetical protein [Rhodococcus artemisiae]|uniref:Condensation domain-containing protein n=1 Tax=Rhodococcus artemisiae TaxID=714159 RepID=A0ABU7LE27_9NOCA|nr:hypothetical protein [Rhodococcus artemisiae]MEE2059810.1 hypothetical protein [Rhodococcus artemisiae]